MTPGLSLCKALSLSSDTLRNFVVSAFDAVDGSSTGIAMCQIAVVIQERLMSAYGTKQTFQPMPRHARFWV
jgi:hypothetical protein